MFGFMNKRYEEMFMEIQGLWNVVVKQFGLTLFVFNLCWSDESENCNICNQDYSINFAHFLPPSQQCSVKFLADGSVWVFWIPGKTCVLSIRPFC